MVWFKSNVFGCALFLITSLTIALERHLSGEKKPGVQVAYACANLHSLPEEGVPVIFLHEITDVKETWDGIYQNIPFLDHRRACIYDARNHGDSAWNDTFTVDVLADDLGSFMNEKKIEKAAIVGHGLGGLTAMKFALRNPDKVERIFVEDISPVKLPKEAIIAACVYFELLLSSLTSIPPGADGETAHKSVLEYIREESGEADADLFKKYPLRLVDGQWQWKSNFKTFIKAFNDPDTFIGKMEGRFDGKVFFIYGEASGFKVSDDEENIKKLFPNSEFHGVEKAGHFIHPNSRDFFSKLINFLK